MKEHFSYRHFTYFLLAAVLACTLTACDEGGTSSAPHSTPDSSRMDENSTTAGSVSQTTITFGTDVQLSWSLLIYGGKDMGGTFQTRMLVITDTTREHFDAYLAKMKKVDYKEISRRTELGNVYVQFYRGADKHLVYAYFLSELGGDPHHRRPSQCPGGRL